MSWLPFRSDEFISHQRNLQQLKLNKQWLFMQSQLAAVAYSIGSLLVFAVLLIATDINFVWRSTILSAESLNEVLTGLSIPWGFWEQAQPNLNMLLQTRDSRLATTTSNAQIYGSWWQFILAIQLFYCFFPRLLCYLYARFLFIRTLNNDLESRLEKEKDKVIKKNSNSIRNIKTVQNLEGDFVLTNWAGIDLQLIREFLPDWFDITNEEKQLKAGPLASESEQKIAERWQGRQLIVVKSWEPPLGELKDYMESGQGYIFPVDWEAEKVKVLQPKHFDEWLRFVSHLSRWQVFCPLALHEEEKDEVSDD
nr:DUF2868 domain-containing protein [Aliikangiella sp. G2MR2-5]